MATTYTLEKFTHGMHYIRLDAKTVAALTKNNNKRVVCTLNNQLAIHSAILHKKDIGYFIQIGMTTCKQLNVQQGSSIKASFTIDTTTYQFNMPEELEEVLDTDQEAHAIFHGLTAGNQRGLIYLVSQVKSTDKKIERALKIAERLKQGITAARVILK